VGVYGLLWLTTRLNLLRLPEGLDRPVLLGVALLCGIGFTMSLFIGTLAFGGAFAAPIRVGVLGGSLVSALLGLALLRRAVDRRPVEHGPVERGPVAG
jgi:NhaA family Na+:H+ antiporter